MILLLTGMLLHVASQYEQESKWLELERAEAIMHQAKTESLRDFLRNHPVDDPAVLSIEYSVGGASVLITLEPIDHLTSEMMLTISFEDMHRLEGFILNHENQKLNRFR
ncbi:hypothetical protein [Salisediminibacterium beveridgei]|uniref:ComG operon protein 7 n=1 Tax=Salisediminibacterium beveridgei TaxID=632773 RepID=A0A1D7QUF2_9BACI|nr:hypothetical protein [Salisediminibacterium beveridgei]AOM82652.1 hypothetical protein BBEV_1287 [Salisediminibacterium beveridgei]